ncbi:hypothetical protein K449DRAFT_438340 [Hypoxylon sp. EC38]|nr:hypothetical protein K449DRAFT_438340 [Hypoxylon sp. EC38]
MSGVVPSCLLVRDYVREKLTNTSSERLRGVRAIQNSPFGDSLEFLHNPPADDIEAISHSDPAQYAVKIHRSDT